MKAKSVGPFFVGGGGRILLLLMSLVNRGNGSRSRGRRNSSRWISLSPSRASLTSDRAFGVPFVFGLLKAIPPRGYKGPLPTPAS